MQPPSPCSRRKIDPPSLRRREWLRVGGLGAFGLGLPALLGTASAAAPSRPASFGRAKSCILIFLTGGPPQHDTFDPKPDAPLEIRGPIGSIPTSQKGVHISELLPLTARRMHQIALIRSMTTEINAHSTSGAFMLSGYLPPSKAENVPPSSQDWPSIAAVAGALLPGAKSPLSSVILPSLVYNNGFIDWPCQTGGFMGAGWDPQVLKYDPSAPEVRIEGLYTEAGMGTVRLEHRRQLLDQLEIHRNAFAGTEVATEFDTMHHRAFDLLHSEKARAAFQIDHEPDAVRDRYGRHKFGQSLLMARRLVEAGTRLVQVNWAREAEEMNNGNPMWDTHSANVKRLREILCPRFDQAYSALLEDLTASGLLDETLVVVMGEFGRSPKINAAGGRDHWGNVFSVALAGARTVGQVIGASDKIGGFPADRPVRPPDLAATLFHLLGIDPGTEFIDPSRRPRSVTDHGTPLHEIVGT
jgi:hypothetical protein